VSSEVLAPDAMLAEMPPAELSSLSLTGGCLLGGCSGRSKLDSLSSPNHSMF
jgi:hypothetical protein